jgi:hypothetical protein
MNSGEENDYGWLNASLAIAAFTKKNLHCQQDAIHSLPFGRALVHGVRIEPGTFFDSQLFLDDLSALKKPQNLKKFFLGVTALLSQHGCEFAALYYDNNPEHEAYGDLVVLHKPDVALWVPQSMASEDGLLTSKAGLGLYLAMPLHKLAKNRAGVRASTTMETVGRQVANELETWVALKRWGRDPLG